MCIFSGRVDEVSSTKIFGRSIDGGRQVLVYSMSFAAAKEVAMILPLPVPPDPPENAVRFISLETYADFFTDIWMAFQEPLPPGVTRSIQTLMSRRVLKVHSVGSFEASFVPTMDDFDRLDDRFRLPPSLWEKLPAYHDFGFAVFKLKATADPVTVHPMAFEFPKRNPDLLFFPTVHIHDHDVQDTATFDHLLYCQADPQIENSLHDWQRSYLQASEVLSETAFSTNVVRADDYLYSQTLKGQLKNQDTLVGTT